MDVEEEITLTVKLAMFTSGRFHTHRYYSESCRKMTINNVKMN